MPSLPITEADIENAFSGVTLDSLIDDTGGFKAVYKAEINGGTEVFKLVALPMGTSPEEKADRKEQLGRVEREVKLLGKLNSSSIVKLGSFAPQIVDGTEISLVEISANAEESVIQLVGTTIHEIGHVMLGVGHGHSPAWKRACHQVVS